MMLRSISLVLAVASGGLLLAQHGHAPATSGHGAHAAAPAAGEAIWCELMDGNKRFVAGTPRQRELVEARRQLAQGQAPRVMVLTCADSRLSPELIFDQGLGDLFVVRTAGNVADRIALGSLEYAAEHLHAGVLVILGHEKCGAVAAAAAGGPVGSPHLEAVVGHIQPALTPLRATASGDELVTRGVPANVHQSAHDVLASSPILAERAHQGQLLVVKAVYTLGSGAVTRLNEVEAVPVATSHTHAPMSPADGDGIWHGLLEGNRRFVAGKPRTRELVHTREQLARGQKPQVIVLTCADSRVPPELLFDQNLGDLFVVRTAGNVADPVALGSLEYAAEHLHASLLVVLGHEKCGAVAAAASGERMPTANLQAIVDAIEPALRPLRGFVGKSALAQQGVAANVHQSAADLLARSQVLRAAVEGKHLRVVKAVYRLDTGEVVDLPDEAAGLPAVPGR